MNDFYKNQLGRYLVVRTYSHTDTRELWKVLTRPIPEIMSADVCREVESKDCPKDQEVFIVKIVNESDAELDLSRQLNNKWHEGYQAAIQSVLGGRHCKGGLTPTVELKQ